MGRRCRSRLPDGLLFSPGFSSPFGLLLFAKEVAVRHWEAFGGRLLTSVVGVPFKHNGRLPAGFLKEDVFSSLIVFDPLES